MNTRRPSRTSECRKVRSMKMNESRGVCVEKKRQAGKNGGKKERWLEFGDRRPKAIK